MQTTPKPPYGKPGEDTRTGNDVYQPAGPEIAGATDPAPQSPGIADDPYRAPEYGTTSTTSSPASTTTSSADERAGLERAKAAMATGGERAKEAAYHAAERAREAAAEGGERAKAGAVEEMERTAHALEAAADELGDAPMQRELFREAANGLMDLSQAVRGRSIGAIVGDLSEFGRRNPYGFLGGAALAGFAIARFAWASAPAQGGGTQPGPSAAGAGAGPGYGRSTDAGSDYGTPTSAGPDYGRPTNG